MPLRALLLALCLPLCALADEPLQLVADRWPPYADAQMPGRGLAVHFVSVALTRAGYATTQWAGTNTGADRQDQPGARRYAKADRGDAQGRRDRGR